MKRFLTIFAAVLLPVVFYAQQYDNTFTFEKYKTGVLPSGWMQFFNGKGKHTLWKITEDGKNKVLAQLSSDNPNLHFNAVVNKNISLKDAEITVDLKAIKGRYDRGGGIIWRMQDKNNYYIVRYNPLEDNVVLYKMQNGIRSDLPVLGKKKSYGVKVSVKNKNGWNTLKVKVTGDLFTVFLNGKEIFKVKDSTFTKPGKVGLWTKADAVTYFDNLKIKKL